MRDLWRLVKLLRPHTLWMLLGVLVSLLAVLANIGLMAVSGWFIASMALAGAAGVSMNYFSPAALIRAAAIVRTAGRYAERLLTHEATFRLLAELRLWFYLRLEPLVPQIIEAHRSGDLFSRIQADIDSLNDFYIRILVPLLVAMVAVVIVVWVASGYALLIGLVLLAMLLLAGLVMPLMTARAGRLPGEQLVKQQSALRIQAIDHLQGYAELLVSGAVQAHRQALLQASQEVIGQQRSLSRLAGLANASMLLLAGLAMWLVVVLAIPRLHAGLLQPADLAMLALFSVAAFEAVLPLPEAFRLLGQVRFAAGRLFSLVDSQPAVAEPQTPAAAPAEFRWQLDQVSFRYPGMQQALLQDISLQLLPGKRIAIVGPTGSGKSTLLQLLLKHRLADAGRVMLDGRELQAYAREDLYQWIACVPQSAFLFNATIRDNLLLGDPLADDAAIDKVLEMTQLKPLLAQQREGLETWIGETGTRLSGGQARRLAIARALLKPHQLLLLDEPTEGLDTQTANALLMALLDGLGNRSLLMITHRLTGLEAFDEILFLENGQLVERGSAAELFELRGRYFQYRQATLGSAVPDAVPGRTLSQPPVAE